MHLHVGSSDGIDVDVDRAAFQEALLQIMEKKVHWAWPMFTSGQVTADKLNIHLEQEYEVYVRDFPRLIAHAFAQCPIAEVRRELAENLFEEETGGLHAGRPHPELFMEYPRGLGMDLSRFDTVELLPASRNYRTLLDDAVTSHGWAVAAAVSTIFIEGTPHERGELDSSVPKRPAKPLEAHPLVVHYGLPIECLALTKAHRGVEGEHRASAWRVMLDHVPSADRPRVLGMMSNVLMAWQRYRDGVADACGLGAPR